MTTTSSTSFITQCPRCATKFRVTQEQLNVSEGWVRCGRCQHIFDAQDHLLDGKDSTPEAPEAAGFEATPPETPHETAEHTAASTSTSTAETEEGHPRPSERWLKELSDTFSPTSPPENVASTADTANTTPTLAAEEAQPATASNADDLANTTVADNHGPSNVAMPTPTAHPPSPEETEGSAPPSTQDEGHDYQIANFHDELKQWHRKQNPLAASPDTDAPEQPQTSAFTDGNANPVLIQASETAANEQRPSTPTEALVDDADGIDLASTPTARTADQATDTEVSSSDDPETEQARKLREEEERLEQYRSEFSETQELRFMREADQKAFWRRPILRSLLAVLALLLLTLLAAQWAYVQRDSIAALSPAWKARMQQGCTWLGCQIQPLQSIEDLVLDGSTFQHLGGNRYLLSWTVINRSKRWLETPAVSLNLRNEAGKTLVRRTITASDIEPHTLELAPTASWKVEQHLVLNDYADAVTGYQLQIFYPNAAK